MTAQKHLKQLVRARMEKTGEPYSTARRQLLKQTAPSTTDPALRWHFPGSVPAATALRSLLTHAGYRTGKSPPSEAMAFGLAGGIGFGMFTFLYEKADFASFYVAGRHAWQDDVAYFKNASKRLGFEPIVRESGSRKQAEQHLHEALAEGPCVAWVDMTALPHRGAPQECGALYHVITIYRADDQQAWIGDLTDQPVAISLEALADTRAAIKKQKNRLHWLRPAKAAPDFKSAVKDALRACHQGMTKQRLKNFTLEALRIWADRLHGSKDKESWDRTFAGPRLWLGLTMAHTFIEYYGTGGGLSRPLFAEFLEEAGAQLGDPRFGKLSKRYAELGQRWTELAHACLPDDVPECREARRLHQQRSEAQAAGGPAAEVQAAWDALAALEKRVRVKFPLSADASDTLRADLQRRVRSLYDGEVAALADLAILAG